MSRTVLAAAILLCTPVVAVAQSGDAPAAGQQDPQAAYQQLAKSYGTAMSEWYAAREQAIAKAQEAGERPTIAPPPSKMFIANAQELADQYAETDAAIPFLTFIVKNATTERNAVRKAISTLAESHAESPAISEALGHLANVQRLGARQEAMALLDEVIANHVSNECKAQALVVRGNMRLASRDTEERDAGIADLRKVPELSKDEDLLAEAKEGLFEVENLAIGCTAPEIDGVDVEGVPFKLSDYRGKVVLLDFWGFW